MSLEIGKKAAGEKAISFIKPGMLVGIGTGSTVFYFIKALIKKCNEGLCIQAVSSSEASSKLAKEGGIEIVDPNHFTQLDITIDGTDEIDANFNMIKGGGGALLREKIIAYHSKKMIVIADETKICQTIGSKKLPVEVASYGLMGTKASLDRLGLHPELRKTKSHEPYLTDNGNYIFDLKLPTLIHRPEELERILHSIPGVIETGLFLGMTKHLIMGLSNGTVEERFKV